MSDVVQQQHVILHSTRMSSGADARRSRRHLTARVGTLEMPAAALRVPAGLLA
jgi:hypothetical protein